MASPAVETLKPRTRLALMGILLCSFAPGTAHAVFPVYEWPLSRALHDHTLIVAYPDHDPGSPMEE